MIKTFISHSHSENHNEKEQIASIINSHWGIHDYSVKMGDINDGLDDQEIRKIIRDNYLKDTTVTIVLAGSNAKHRKHIDWEIFSSMFDGEKNKQSGIVVIDMLANNVRTSYDSVKQYYSNGWTSLSNSYTRNKYEHMPKRIVDNLINDNAEITVISYQKIMINYNVLYNAIIEAHDNRSKQKYDLSEPMRKKNNNTWSIY